jgi:hypothetical protein
MVDPYRYQLAVIWSHPNCYPCSSSNYREAQRSRVPLGATGTSDKEGEREYGGGVEQKEGKADGEGRRHPLAVELTQHDLEVPVLIIGPTQK